ncbi:hypothetical protein M5D96_003856, partial [Drosophila gunungcola]
SFLISFRIRWCSAIHFGFYFVFHFVSSSCTACCMLWNALDLCLLVGLQTRRLTTVPIFKRGTDFSSAFGKSKGAGEVIASEWLVRDRLIKL